jgi:hypothetical protein
MEEAEVGAETAAVYRQTKHLSVAAAAAAAVVESLYVSLSQCIIVMFIIIS